MTVSVPAGALIRHGDTAIQFSDLHVGDRVEIHGTRSGAVIVATTVNDEVEAAEPNEPNDDGANHDGEDHHGDDSHEGPGRDGTGGGDHGSGDDSSHRGRQ